MSKTFGSPHTTTHFIKDSFINNNISDLQNHKDSIISLRENIKNKRVNINEQIKNELITTIQNINNKDINDTKKVLENSISKLGKVKALEDINRELTTYITATNEQIRDLNKTTVNIQ